MAYASPADLAALLQVQEVDTYTAQLCLDGAAALMQAAGAPVDIDPVPSDLRYVCASLAAQGYSNPKGLRAVQENLGSAGRTETYAGTASEIGLSLTAAQVAVCRRYRQRVNSVRLSVEL
jgi:hypothetical protein